MIAFNKTNSRPKSTLCLATAWIVFAFVANSLSAQQDLSEAELEAFQKAQTERIQAIDRCKQATVCVLAPSGNNGGSGVVIDERGYALTNFHVVKPCGNFMKCAMADGVLYDAALVGVDPVGDVALIRLFSDKPFPTAELGDSSLVRTGDWCFAIGNPFLLATDFNPTVSYGIVSGVHRYQFPAGTLLEYTDCIQTDAAINPGNSGGPLFNAQGQLIGINGRGSFEKRGRVNVGVGYAISVNQTKNFIGCLMSGRIVDHATLGATVDLDDKGKVVVTNLLPQSDAAYRGLDIGDEIISFGDRDIRSVNEFKNVLGIYPRGWRVPITFRKAGEEISTYVRLAGVHSPEKLVEMIQGPLGAPPKPSKPAPENELPSQEAVDFFEPAPGFANIAANRRQLQTTWSAFIDKNDTALYPAKWTIQGQIADRGKVEAAFQPDAAGIQVGEQAELLDLTQVLSQQLGPEGSGGLLVALHAWHRFLTLGPDQFGQVISYGTSPWDDLNVEYNVLIATSDTLENRLYFDPSTCDLRIWEMIPDVQADSCILDFSDYRSTDGFRLPYQVQVRSGYGNYGTLVIESYSLSEADSTQEETDE